MRTTTRARRAVVAVAAVVLALAGVGRADDKPKDDNKLTVMQRKLKHAQTVLEGLATNNFDKIGKGGEGLIECVQHATLKINETEKYVLYSNDFLRRAEGLKKAAKEKNIDSAPLAYVDMTLTCVKCHQYLREPAAR